MKKHFYKSFFVFCMAGLLTSCAQGELDIQVEAYTGEFARAKHPLVAAHRQKLAQLKALEYEIFQVSTATGEYFELSVQLAAATEALAENTMCRPQKMDIKKYLAGRLGQKNAQLYQSMQTAQTVAEKAVDDARTAQISLHDNNDGGPFAAAVLFDMGIVQVNRFQNEAARLLENIRLILGTTSTSIKIFQTNSLLPKDFANRCSQNSPAETAAQYSTRLTELHDFSLNIVNDGLISALNDFSTKAGHQQYVATAVGDLRTISPADWPKRATELQNQLSEVIVATDKTRISFNTSTSNRVDDLRALARKRSFYNSQLDRLQDPADIAWAGLNSQPLSTKDAIDQYIRTTDKNGDSQLRRVVETCQKATDDPGRPCWSEIARTKFYAEGNADTVVVQDRIGNWKIKRATNNPTALIKGQLQITRSVAIGATKIIGAVSGVGGVFPTPAPGSDGSTPADGTTPTAPTSSQFFAESKRAELEAEQSRRLRANLAIQLSSLLARINAATNNAGASLKDTDALRSNDNAALEDEAKALAEAYEKHFRPAPED